MSHTPAAGARSAAPTAQRFPFLRSMRPAALALAVELSLDPDGPLLLDECGLGPDVRGEFIAAALAERAAREGRA